VAGGRNRLIPSEEWKGSLDQTEEERCIPLNEWRKSLNHGLRRRLQSEITPRSLLRKTRVRGGAENAVCSSLKGEGETKGK